MNCQIIQIESSFLVVEILSSFIDSNFKIGYLVEIDKNGYFESETFKTKSDKSFGRLIEIDNKKIKLQLLKPELFILGKIIKLSEIKEENIFFPQILNQKIIFGDKIEFDTEQVFEFIPTILSGEEVKQGQKIGYLTIQNSLNQNFKYWILAEQDGKITKIELGDFRLGEQIVSINKSNFFLGNIGQNIKNTNLLLKTNPSSKTLELQSGLQNSLQIKINQSNLIIDEYKKFLNKVTINSQQLENFIIILITTDPNFVINNTYRSIIFFDKYNLNQAIANSVNEMALNICNIGYNALIISQNWLDLNAVGQYKTVNGEEVGVTYILQDSFNLSNSDNFDNLIVIE